jgi:hypothetical protein
MLQNCLRCGDRRARVYVNATHVKKAVFENPNKVTVPDCSQNQTAVSAYLTYCILGFEEIAA